MAANLNNSPVFTAPQRQRTKYLTMVMLVLFITQGITCQARLLIKQNATTEKRKLSTSATAGAVEKERHDNANGTVLGKHNHPINPSALAAKQQSPRTSWRRDKHLTRNRHLATKSALQHNRLRDNNVYPTAQGKTRHFYCPTKNTPCYRVGKSGKKIYYACNAGSYCDQVYIAE